LKQFVQHLRWSTLIGIGGFHRPCATEVQRWCAAHRVQRIARSAARAWLSFRSTKRCLATHGKGIEGTSSAIIPDSPIAMPERAEVRS
jgi:hypothetical protein